MLRQLEQARLRPSRDADRITFLRRVWLDLTGLPPTPEEADAFLQAKRRLETELLNFSPRLGEWERHLQDRLKEARSRNRKTRFQPFPDAAWAVRSAGGAIKTNSCIQIPALRQQPERFLVRADSWEGQLLCCSPACRSRHGAGRSVTAPPWGMRLPRA